MKHLLILCLLISSVICCGQDAKKVLLYVKEESPELEYMLLHEVIQMRNILEKAGVEVTTFTISGETLETDFISIHPDIKLDQVDVTDFDGLIMPCMVVDTSRAEAIQLVQSVAKLNKPIAAQVGSVFLLANAGLLEGKKYAFFQDLSKAELFKDCTYIGSGVVRDGNIVTSGTCPWLDHMLMGNDGTRKLTQTFISMIE